MLNHLSSSRSSGKTLLFFLVLLTSLTEPITAGPIAASSGISMCYTACNAGYVSCMAGCGLVAGVASPLAGPAALACSVTQGACMATCTAGGLAVLVAPTP
ncbi:MAG: hypothetical protein SGBAC_011921 [Bacillariaceae sp.]